MNVGLDGGYSAFKVVSGAPPVFRTFPSVRGEYQEQRFALDPQQHKVIEHNGQKWFVGESAISQSRFTDREESRDWIKSDLYRTLFLTALSETSTGTRVPTKIVTGLPVAFYEQDRDALKLQLLGEYRIQRNGRSSSQLFQVEEVRVIMQPVGTLLSIALYGNGKIQDQELVESTAGVLDVGGKTTNALCVARCAEVTHQTDSISLGAWDIVRALRQRYAEVFPGLELRDHEIISTVVNREVVYYGETEDTGPHVDEVLEPLAKEVANLAMPLWEGGVRLSTIVLTGGGSILLENLLRQMIPHKNVVLAPRPVYANAMGYWKLANRVWS